MHCGDCFQGVMMRVLELCFQLRPKGVLMSRVLLSLLVLCGGGLAEAHESMIFDVEPSDDWCNVINTEAMPGDIIRLAPGAYLGPCLIDRAPDESQQEYTQVISLDAENRARIVYDGSSDFLLRVVGEQIMLVALNFEGLPEGVPAVEVLGERAIWVLYCNFSDLPGTAIAVTSAVNGLYLLHNFFERVGTAFELELNSEKTVLDIGGNLFQDVGQMVRISGDWSGSIRNNIAQEVAQGVVVGPGLHAAGVQLDGNWIQGSGTGFRVSSGPVFLRNNILQGAGIAWDFGEADEAFGAVSVLGNSFIQESESPFVFRGSSAVWDVANNLSTRAFPAIAEASEEVNANCDPAEDCWENAAAGQFYPSDRQRGVVNSDLAVDFCGRERIGLPTLGALEPACPQDPTDFQVEFKADFPCTFSLLGDPPDCPVPDERPEPGDSGDTGEPEPEPESCGCGSAGGLGGGLVWLPALVLVGWRQRIGPKLCP